MNIDRSVIKKALDDIFRKPPFSALAPSWLWSNRAWKVSIGGVPRLRYLRCFVPDMYPILPAVTKDLPISPRCTPYEFLLRCKFRTLTTRQPMVEFYLLTFPRFPLRRKEHKSYFGKNQTHDFRTTSRCAGYLLDHSGDDAKQ